VISTTPGTNKSSINILFHYNYYYSMKALVNSEIINRQTLLESDLLKEVKFRNITELVLDLTLFQVMLP